MGKKVAFFCRMTTPERFVVGGSLERITHFTPVMFLCPEDWFELSDSLPKLS